MTTPYDAPVAPSATAAVYAARRARLARAMGGGTAVIPTAPEKIRNRDAHYSYRYDSYFYYLTGFTEPDAVLVLAAGAEASVRSVLFCRPRDPEREIWDGRRYGPEGACAHFGFDACHAIAELDAMMPRLLTDQPALFCHLGEDPAWDRRVLGWVEAVRLQARSGVAAPAAINDVHAVLDDMRLVKDAGELDTMRRAAAISARAHRRAMRASRPGAGEHEIEAELLHEFRRSGAQAPAYTSIVAGGANACVLHYVENNAPLSDGDLLLIDAGCELDGYASDITRTFPVNGRFSAAQRDVYEVVLAAQAAAIAAAVPGAPWPAPHDAAVRVLAQGFVDLGLCRGTPEAVIESGVYKQFYMHRTGHWLGLDVHDAGEYKRDGEWRALVPGMVLTVEPGCYIRPADNVPRALWNIGIRIEDDVAVTASGNEVLSADAPKTVADIEAWMGTAMADAVPAQADIVIAGGGPAGATLALALREDRRSICVIEPRQAAAAGAPGVLEGRALAMSHGSRLILERVGVWAALGTVTPITEIHISQRGGVAGARITAQESAVPALGYMVSYGALSAALDKALAAAEQSSNGRLGVLRGHALEAAQPSSEGQIALQLTPPQPLAARLLAVADGGAGPQLAEAHERDYGQSALSCLVESDVPHRNHAYEHFTPAGPLALLPHPRGWSLVWVTPPAETERLLALDPAAFCRELGAAFGPHLGAFRLLGERRSFALRLRYARTPNTPRTVLVGAAAQTLHPVAGQGLNLGLRDAWELARTLIVHADSDPGAEAMLARYRRRRRRDRFATSAFTDTLIRLFCNDIPGLSAGRGLGLALFDSLPPVKRFVARRMMFGAHGG